MEKAQRLTKGKEYWYVDEYLEVSSWEDRGDRLDDRLFKVGNYFATREKAEMMANKLRAVLKGVEVIEVPSEEEVIHAKPIDEFYVRPSVEQYETPRR